MLASHAQLLEIACSWMLSHLHLHTVRAFCGELKKMLTGKYILRSAVLVAIGGLVALFVSKLLEGDEAAVAERDMSEIRGRDDLNKAEKKPQEHDESLC